MVQRGGKRVPKTPVAGQDWRADRAATPAAEPSPDFLDALACGVIVCDADGTITSVNAVAADLLGRPSATLVGRSVYDTSWWPPIVLDADERPSDLPIVVDGPKDCGGHWEEQVVGLAAAEGAPVSWVALQARPLCTADGCLQAVVCSLLPLTGSHRSTRQLWARAGRLRALLDHLPDTYFVLDREDRIVEWFGGEAPFLPGARPRLLGTQLAVLLPPESAVPALEAFAEVRSGLPTAGFDLAWDDDHGRRFGHAVCRLLPEGYVGVIVRDATERWLAEEELLTLEEQYRLLAEHAQDVIARVRCRPTLAIEYVSPAVERVLGYAPEVFYRDPEAVFRMVRPEWRDQMRQILAGHWDFDRPWECGWTHADGHDVHIEQRMHPVWGADGSLVALELVARDSTERRFQTDQLRRREELFRLLVEHSRDVVWRTRLVPEPRIEYVSPSVVDVLGYTSEELLREPSLLWRLLAPECHPQAERVLRGEVESGELQVMRWKTRDGRDVHAEGTVSVISDEHGRAVAVQGVFRDITARLAAERQAGPP